MPLQLCIDYPENLPDAMAESRQTFEREAKLAMAVKLFEMQRISSGHAAALAGLDRAEFLLKLKEFGASTMNFDPAELADDIQNA